MSIDIVIGTNQYDIYYMQKVLKYCS
jgi:hypothetical protein